MKTLNLLAASLSLVAMGCTAAQPQPASTQSFSQLEVLHGIRVGESTITVAVSSNGCTSADSFELSVNDAQKTLKVLRVKADKCRRRAFVIDIELPVLSASLFSIVNPFSAQ